MTQKEAFDVIAAERKYQDSKWPKPQHSHSVEEYLVYIYHHLNRAMTLAATQNGTWGAQDELRKIGGLVVACMEENGSPERSPTTH